MEFEIVQLWHNPYIINRTITVERYDEKSEPLYAIKVNGLYFNLGTQSDSLHVCDNTE